MGAPELWEKAKEEFTQKKVEEKKEEKTKEEPKEEGKENGKEKVFEVLEEIYRDRPAKCRLMKNGIVGIRGNQLIVRDMAYKLLIEREVIPKMEEAFGRKMEIVTLAPSL